MFCNNLKLLKALHLFYALIYYALLFFLKPEPETLGKLYSKIGNQLSQICLIYLPFEFVSFFSQLQEMTKKER